MADPNPPYPQHPRGKTAAPTAGGKTDEAPGEAPPGGEQPPTPTPTPTGEQLDFDEVLSECCTHAPYLITYFELVRALGHALNDKPS